MLNTNKLNEISNKIREMVNSSPLSDVDQNIHALIRSMLTKMELVSREEFDVQAEVLRNTREKLAVLEAKLAELEFIQKHSQ
ncbi:MAG: accessory factor UbiK family protein [Methylotenera sp.]